MDDFQASILLDNAKEHLRITRQNIQAAQDELNSTIEKRDAVLGQIERAQARAKEQEDRFRNEESSRVEQYRSIDNKILELNRREQHIHDHEKEHEEKVARIKKDIEEQEMSRVRLHDEVVQLLTSRNKLKEEIQEASQRVASEESKISRLVAVHDEWRRSAQKEKADTENDIQSALRELMNVLTALKGANGALVDTTIKNEESSKFLDEREAMLNNKEQNIRRVQQRINNIFKELYPHLAPPIL